MMSESKMPVVFIGHGSPMNAIEDNPFSKTLVRLGKELPKPKAILCISAHWLTARTWLSHTPCPKTIHDFHHFPQPLFEVQYQAPGDPRLAEQIKASIQKPRLLLDEHWGLDHGAWSVLKHMYPKADIPIIELSIDMSEPAEFHFELGKNLKTFRDQGVLIIGSGNIVHNLKEIIWDNQNAEPYLWATEFDEQVKQCLLQRDFPALMGDLLYTPAGRLSVPTADHYYPLLYVLGASDNKDSLRFEYEEIQNGSISMRTLSLGLS